MKFPVKSPMLRPRLFGFKGTTGSGGSLSVGASDISSWGGSGTSLIEPTLSRPFNQAPITVLSIESDVGAGGAGMLNWGTADSSVSTPGSFQSIAPTGGSDAGTLHGLVFGQDSIWTDTYGRHYDSADIQRVKTTRGASRLMGFSFNDNNLRFGAGDGTISIQATGRNTITFNKPFASEDVFVAVCANTSIDAENCRVTAVSSSSVTVEMCQAGTGTLSNKSVSLLVLGFDAADERVRDSELLTSQPGCRLLGVRGDSSGNLVSGQGVSVARLSLGRYRVTYAYPFKREPVCIASGQDARATAEPSGTTTVDVYCWETGTPYSARDSIFSLLVVGWDADEILNN